MFSQVHNL